jgi:hypothetical protein
VDLPLPLKGRRFKPAPPFGCFFNSKERRGEATPFIFTFQSINSNSMF